MIKYGSNIGEVPFCGVKLAIIQRRLSGVKSISWNNTGRHKYIIDHNNAACKQHTKNQLIYVFRGQVSEIIPRHDLELIISNHSTSAKSGHIHFCKLWSSLSFLSNCLSIKLTNLVYSLNIISFLF